MWTEFIDIPHNFLDTEKNGFEFKSQISLEPFNTDEEIIENVSEEKIKNINFGKWHLFCFNHALNNAEIRYMEDGIEVLYNEDYKIIKKIKDIRKGDIAVFYDTDFRHLAKVIQGGNKIGNIVIRSKFGRLGVYEHKIKNTPDLYGEIVLFFRKKN